MFRKPSFAVIAVTIYLVVYYILFLLNVPLFVLFCMFMLSPFLVGWLVITILKYGRFTGNELKENEEWGYADKEKSSLKTF